MPLLAVKPPPPYSCTRVRALKGCGVTSSVRLSGVSSTITLRPPSPGRLSSQYTSPPSVTTSASPTTLLTITSEEIGDLQEPYGATLCSDMVPLLRISEVARQRMLQTGDRYGYAQSGRGEEVFCTLLAWTVVVTRHSPQAIRHRELPKRS